MGMYLVADIGGTKSRIALVDHDGGTDTFHQQKTYLNQDFSGVEELLANYLGPNKQKIAHCCLAMAGVVAGKKGRLTNLPWEINGKKLGKRFGWQETELINDMTALSHAIPFLDDDDLLQLQEGKKLPGEPIAVIAPGTGLGQGYLLPHNDGYLQKGSEGGHSGFAPANEEEIRIARWFMKKKGNPASVEQLCSGPGITTLFQYYTEEGGFSPLDPVARRLLEEDDSTPVIVDGALQEGCPVCKCVLSTFLSILGSEAANLALKLYARGGVFIGGGVVEHIAREVSFAPFLLSFSQKEKMEELLAAIPVYIVKRSEVLLIGALQHIKASRNQ